MSETENKIQTDDNKETHRHSHHHHSHHSHHHSHHHHSHHHSSKSGKKNKVKKFLKSNKKRLRYIAIALALAVVLIIVAFSLDGSLYSNKKSDTSKVSATNSSIQIEVPLYTEPISLVDPVVNNYLESDSKIGAAQYYKEYRKSGQRLDIGQPVTLYYNIKGIPDGYSVDSSKILVSETDSFNTALTYIPEKGEKSIEIYNLKTNTQYFYKIELILSDGNVTSTQGSFKTADTPRMLNVDGAVNVRDFGGRKTTGGKTVRQGLLIRGSELDGAVVSDFFATSKGINQLINDFDIHTDMDLRSPTANQNNTHTLGNNVEHIYYNAHMYTEAFEPEGKTALRAIFADLADSSKYPVYMHCTYGTDRTGTVCYILGALLGVDKHELMQDYQLSTFYHGTVDEDNMTAFIAKLDTYSGNSTMEKAESFLLSIGVTPQEIASIRGIFLGE